MRPRGCACFIECHSSMRFRPAHASPISLLPSRGTWAAVDAELHGGRDLPPGIWRLKQQGKSIGVMKIRFVGWMAKRPVREPIARLDDRGEPDTKSRTRVSGRQAIEPDKGVQLKPAVSRTHGDVRAGHLARERTAVAI